MRCHGDHVYARIDIHVVYMKDASKRRQNGTGEKSSEYCKASKLLSTEQKQKAPLPPSQ